MRLAGSLELGSVLAELQRRRPVFHSEADFQHALAWVAHKLDPSLRVRLETHPEAGVRLDLLFARPDLRRETAVELKYLTEAWTGIVDGERYELRNQAAQDIRAYDVVKDLHRVERFVARHPGSDGAVLTLSNHRGYWTRPGHGRATNADAFRIFEGTELTGVRDWGPSTGSGTKKGREAELALPRPLSMLVDRLLEPVGPRRGVQAARPGGAVESLPGLIAPG